MKFIFFLLCIFSTVLNCGAQNNRYNFLNDWLNNQVTQSLDTLIFQIKYNFKEDSNENFSNLFISKSALKCLKDTFPELGKKAKSKLYRRRSALTNFNWDIKKLKIKEGVKYTNEDGWFSAGRPVIINDTLVALCTPKHSIHKSYHVSIWYWNKKTKEVRYIIGRLIYTTNLKFR